MIQNFLSLLLIPLCIFGWFKDNRSEAEKTFDEVLNQGIKFVEQKYKLKAIGSGGGMPDGSIHNFNITLEHKGILSIDDARFLLVNITNDFVQIVNKNPKIKPYLYNFPFTDKDISLMVIIKSVEGDDLIDPYLGSIGQCAGELWYKTFKKINSNTYPRVFKEKREIFEDAVKILQKQQNS